MGARARGSGAIGLLHPGEMGSSVGAALQSKGAQVAWASNGRSEATRRRALSAGLGSAAAKAWRFRGEMEEIARSLREAGLPGGFHEAAAEIYGRLERFKDDPQAPGGADLARWLLDR